MRFPALLCALLLAGCASLGPPATPPHVYVLLGEQGAATVRAITTAAHCPDIEVDGRSVPMNMRAAAGTLPLRPPASPLADHKASSFPVTTCEAPLPLGARSARIGAQVLPLPKPTVQRIAVIGDTGCRMIKRSQTWQNCNDPEAFPLAAIARAVADWQPELVIHVGDYLYREDACPPGRIGCAGSPWGFGWDAWEADFFGPARPMLLAAPLVAGRGNHESCQRGGQGFWRLLDPRPLLPGRDCLDARQDRTGDHGAPYVVPLGGGAQLAVLDTSANRSAGYSADDWRIAALAADMEQLEAISEQAPHTLALLHHPPLSLGGEIKNGQTTYFAGDRGMLQALGAWDAALLPARVQAILSGHIHMWQQVSYASAHPSQFVVGHGGTAADLVPIPDPLPASLQPPGAQIARLAALVGEFGFMTMERRGPEAWDITVIDHQGRPRRHCRLQGRASFCQP